MKSYPFFNFIAAIGVTSALATSATAQTRYFIETIPALPADNPRSQANAVNEYGVAAGLSNIPGNSEAFFFDNGVTTSIGNLGLGGGFTSASGINDAGVMVGTGSVDSGGTFRDRAFVWQPGIGFTAVLDPENADLGANTNAVNNAGQVVGVYRYSGFDRQGFVYQVGDAATDYSLLPFLPGSDTASGARQFVNAINDAGVVAGAGRTQSGQPTLAARWIPDGFGGYTVETLPNPTGGTTFANGFGINDAGDIVGSFSDSGTFPAIWSADGTVTLLDLASGATTATARDINNLGTIVGEGSNIAFVVEGGVTYDLNFLIDGPSDFAALTSARAINDAGQIVGFGTLAAGGIRGFVLTPVPEPASLFTMLAGGGLFALVRRRK